MIWTREYTARWLSWVMGGLLFLSTSSIGWAFSIKPGAQVLRENPDKTVKVSFEVQNDQEVPLVVTSQMRDSFVLPENKDISVSAWLEPQFKEIAVPAHGSRKALFKVHVPQKASGELAGLVSFIPKTEDKYEKPVSTAAIQTRIVTLITVSLYVRVKGTEKGEADVGEVRVANVPAASGEPAQVEATAVVKNTGNVHQRPTTHFAVRKKEGGPPLYTMEVPWGWPVMPYSDFPYKARTPGTLSAGSYVVKAKVTFTPKTFIEKETAFMVNTSGNTTNYVELR